MKADYDSSSNAMYNKGKPTFSIRPCYDGGWHEAIRGMRTDVGVYQFPKIFEYMYVEKV